MNLTPIVEITTGQLAAGQFPVLTGDITTPGGSLATTLKATGPGAGAYGGSGSYPTFSLDANGRVTAVTTYNLTSTPTVPFAAYGSGTTYAANQVVIGSDSNLYISQVSSNIGNSPVADSGANWKLWVLQANLTLNCGGGSTQFPDTYAASGSPGGAMTPGMQSAIAFISNAVGAISPSVATCTIQQSSNTAYTFSASANGSTTTIKTTTNVPVGASILGTGGHNIGTTNTVTASSYSSGTYTLTVTAMTSTVSGDTYQFAPFYGTSTITANLPIIGANVNIQGSTSNVTVPMFWPIITTSGSGSIGAGTYYCAVTYTWSDASGTTRETMYGPVQSITVGSSGKIICAGFTLPAGATGANLYAVSTLNGTLEKQAAFSVSGGVASALTISTYNGSGGVVPTANPAPSTWYQSMCWASTFTGTCLSISNANLTITSLGLYSTSGGALEIGVFFNGCNNATLTNCIISSFGGTLVYAQNTSLTINNNQFDTSLSVGIFGQNRSNISNGQNNAGTSTAINAAINCTNYGFAANDDSNITINPGGSAMLTNSPVAIACGTGFQAAWSSVIRFQTGPTGGQQTWKTTTIASPSVGSTGNENSYIGNG